jgi:hypothetical protein
MHWGLKARHYLMLTVMLTVTPMLNFYWILILRRDSLLVTKRNPWVQSPIFRPNKKALSFDKAFLLNVAEG